MTADGSMSGMGDSIAHGDEKSAVKNTAPDKRTTRSTSDRTSITAVSCDPAALRQGSGQACRSNGQGFQSLNQRVKGIRCFGQETGRSGHRTSAVVPSGWLV